MTKQKQIEEMAGTMCGYYNNGQCLFCNYESCNKFNTQECSYKEEAEMLYDAGYRKGETYNCTAMIDNSYPYHINQFENILAEARKETAKDMAKKLKDAFTEYDIENMCPALYCDDFYYILNKVLKEYGVEE